MALRAAERNAITKARARSGARAVGRLRDGVYAVRSASRTGVGHIVTVDACAYRCACEAGQPKRVSWHQAAVFVAAVARAGGARVTGLMRTATGRLPAPLRLSLIHI